MIVNDEVSARMSPKALPSPPRPLVGSVVQALAILRYLGRNERSQGVSAVARELGISPSSCFNILKTLAAEEMATFDPHTRAYALGLGAIELSRLALGRDEVLRAARAAMREVAEDCDVAVGLWRLGADERLTLIAMAESEAATRIHLVVGQRQPAGVGAAGRAVLAGRDAPDTDIRAAVDTGRWRRAPTPEHYLVQVREARTRGWALDVDQIIHGVTTVAAAIRDIEGHVRFCLSASTFTGRETEARTAAIGCRLRELADRISRTVYGVSG